MRDVLGRNTLLGYCTNVHAGADLDAMMASLEHHAVGVKRRVSPNAPMGLGLWLSQTAMASLTRRANGEADLRARLEQMGLDAFTFNGFPYGNFHDPIVKHRVYQPAWDDPARAGYTLALAVILAKLARRDEASISTLPIGWPTPPAPPIRVDQAIQRLHLLADALHRLHDATGVLVHVDLEPEPGCLLQRAQDVVDFFEGHLLAPGAGATDEAVVRRHIRVCHDVCHAAVMFESQADVLATYRRAGIGVGKVQISSAVRVDLDERPDALDALAAFSEPRYLHQTVVRNAATARLYEDLPLALRDAPRRGEWRVHFHVPVYLDRVGPLDTTQGAILECLRALRPDDHVRHFEVETYAWNVLPRIPTTQPVDELSQGIAKELQWVREQASALGLSWRG